MRFTNLNGRLRSSSWDCYAQDNSMDPIGVEKDFINKRPSHIRT